MVNDITFEEHVTEYNYIIAEISLNNEKRLNALDLHHLTEILDYLTKWEEQSNVLAIFIRSTVKKSFCAGGDIRKLYHYVLEESKGRPNDYFKLEYQLNYLIHTYTKPIICWANGIVMGGGLGLMTGCDFRIVNDSSILAMPEVKIGFYPDTGAAFFLGRLPKDIGLFIAITGCNLNAADAIYLGLADYHIDEAFKEQFFRSLLDINWRSVDVGGEILRLVTKFNANSEGWEPYSKVREFRDTISGIMAQPSFAAVMSAIESLVTNDPWLSEARDKALSSSCLSQKVTYEFFKDCKKLSLKEVLMCEKELSTKLVWEGDFFEGVRSVLIDKNRASNWKYKNIQNIDIKKYYDKAPLKYIDREFL